MTNKLGVVGSDETYSSEPFEAVEKVGWGGRGRRGGRRRTRGDEKRREVEWRRRWLTKGNRLGLEVRERGLCKGDGMERKIYR